MNRACWMRWSLGSLAVLTACGVAPAAERPTAMRLFPSRTVFFIRTADATEMSERFDASAGGRMGADPDLAPFLQSLYDKVDAAFRGGPGKHTGGGLTELLELFQGEVAFAVVPRRNDGPGLLFLADTVSQSDRAAGDAEALTTGRERVTRMIESLRSTAPDRGRTVGVEAIGSAEVTVFREGDDAALSTGFLERDGVLVFSNDRLLLESVVTKWDDELGVSPPDSEASDEAEEAELSAEAKRLERLRLRYAEPLSEKEGFTESLRQCVEERLGGGDESPPQLFLFVDPIAIFKAVAQNNAGARIAYATLPTLGLDGVQGAAAAMWMDEGQWDSLLRAHLLLDNPRAGVLKLLRLAPTDTTPGDAVPANVVRYACGAVDLAEILDGAERLHDKVRGEGKFDELVAEQFTKRLGVTPEEVIALFTGRFVSMQAYGESAQGVAPRIEPPRAVLLSIHDATATDQMLRSVLEKLEVNVAWETHGGIEYAARPWPDDAEFSEEARAQADRPCVAIVGEQLVVTQSLAILRRVIDTHLGEHPRLADHLPFRLTANRSGRLGAETVGGEEGRMLIYEDATPMYERLHASLTTDEGREQIEFLAERAPPFRFVRDTLNEVEIPPVETLLRYAAPAGSALYDTPRGFRYVGFSFRPAE